MGAILEFTDTDWKRAEQLRQQERVSPITRETLLPAIIYCLLSATEYYEKQMQVYHGLEAKGLLDAKAMLSYPDEVRASLSIARYGNSKADRLLRLADWWTETDWPERLQADASNGRDLEFTLRDKLAKARVGMGWKCSSLLMRMCDYENIVPVDLWAARVLKQFGYEITVPKTSDKGRKRKEQLDLLDSLSEPAISTTEYHNPKGGISGGTYAKYERLFTEIADQFGISPATFQLLIYTKFSTVTLQQVEQRKLDLSI